MIRKRLTSFAVASFLGLAAANTYAQFSMSSPTTNWTPVAYAPGVSGDPKTDHQTGQGEGDIVGNTGSAATALPSFYTHFVAGTTPTNGTLHFRARMGGDHGTPGFKAALIIGVDANRDGKLDIFVGVNNSGQANGIYIWKPGSQANTSPATMDVNGQSPLKKYTEVAANYHWGAVNDPSSTAGVVLDPTADTVLRRDFNEATGTDYLLSFSIPFADLVAALNSRGITFTSSTPLAYVMGSATQANSINQDLNNVMGGTSSTSSWAALGALTQPMTVNGTVVNTPPVNTAPASATVNGSRALTGLTGVSVADAEGNIATVRVTASTGTLSVSLIGGASIVAGANGTGTLTLAGTPEQINAALATLGYISPVGVTGPATVTILSTDTSGTTDQDTIALTLVSQPNSVPVANADTATTHSGKPVTSYVVGNDTDGDGNILTITSAALTSGSGTVSSANGSITFTPSNAFVGNAVITYAISDGLGGTSTSTFTVQVSANTAPVAANDSLNANPNTIIFINVLGNDQDGDGDPLTITSATVTSGSGTVTISGSELQFDAPGGNGTTVISYTISDGFGGTSTATATVVRASNTAPVAANDTATTNEGAPVDVPVLANDQDANGDVLTIGDATVTSGSGTVIAVGNLLRFTPAPGFTGTATITYTVEDGRGGTSTATLTVTVNANTAPTVVADSYSTSEDTVLNVAALQGVLANDVDPQGSPLTATLVTGPTNGTLVFNSNGSFTYTPNGNYAGPDSFTYRASDGSLNSTPATVSLTVNPVNDTPVGLGNSYSVNENATLTVGALAGLLANDSDLDGDTLSAVPVTNPAHGTLTLNADGSFTYVPTPGYSGPDSFTYRATDGSLSTAPLTVNLTVVNVNGAPTAAADSYTVASGSTLTVTQPNGVLFNDSDPDSDPLSAVVASGPANGSLTLNTNGSFSYTPNAGFTGTDTFTYRASDGVATSAPVQVSVVVTATPPPTTNRPPAVTVALKMATSISVPLAFPVDTSDLDGDTVTLTEINPINGTLTRTPTGYIYTPRDGFAGTDTFKLVASDGRGGVVLRIIKVSVTAPDDVVGNYAALLRDASGQVSGHIFFTTTKLGRSTGLLSIKGVRYNFRGFFGGVPSVLRPVAKGFPTATLSLSMNRANPAGPALVINATDVEGTFTGETPRSPYSNANPAPQMGKYTIIASRSAMVLGRTGVTLSDAGADVPTVGAALTVNVSKIGAAIFVGKAGHGYPLACSSYIMANDQVPFYAGRNNPGGTMQHGTMVFASAPSTGDLSAPPAVSGLLSWNASLDRRIPEPFTAEYAVLGARYTKPLNGAGLLNAPSVTLSIDETPTFVQAGLPQPYQDTRAFVNNTLPRAAGNIAIVRVNLGNGMFLSAVQGHLPRPIFGVIIQGEGIDRGLGGVVDYYDCGTFEMVPVR